MNFTITPLLTGVRNPDQGIMTYQQGYGTRIWLPIWSFLIEGRNKMILADTGLDENELFTPAGFEKEVGMIPATLKEGLAANNITPEDIDIVINTHLHDDHCGNNNLFTESTFYVHRDELSFCRKPHPIDHRYDDYFIEGIDFIEIEKETELLPGLELLPMPGHTPGTMAVKVATNHGTTVITGFCCNSRNFPDNGPAICPGVHTDAIAAWDSIQKIKEMKATILPMHELHLPVL
jgi:glyoxylase-like metal-dependent hydrolase (beta-lactamase superfamily II)